MFQKTKSIFIDALKNEVDTTRMINDKSPSSGEKFEVELDTIEGIADNLATWWLEGYDEIPTQEEAENYIDEVYPEA